MDGHALVLLEPNELAQGENDEHVQPGAPPIERRSTGVKIQYVQSMHESGRTATAAAGPPARAETDQIRTLRWRGCIKVRTWLRCNDDGFATCSQHLGSRVQLKSKAERKATRTSPCKRNGIAHRLPFRKQEQHLYMAHAPTSAIKTDMSCDNKWLFDSVQGTQCISRSRISNLQPV